MTTLTDQEVDQIVRNVAQSNNVRLEAVSVTTASPSVGEPALEIKLVLTPGSSASIMGRPAALTTSQVVQQLADRGEERFPIVRFEEDSAARP
jgi:hypothetical protein